MERKQAVLKKMLPPNNMALRQLSQEEGISEATLHKWRTAARGKGRLLPDADTGPGGWGSRDKFAAVLEAAAMNDADLAVLDKHRYYRFVNMVFNIRSIIYGRMNPLKKIILMTVM